MAVMLEGEETRLQVLELASEVRRCRVTRPRHSCACAGRGGPRPRGGLRGRRVQPHGAGEPGGGGRGGGAAAGEGARHPRGEQDGPGADPPRVG